MSALAICLSFLILLSLFQIFCILNTRRINGTLRNKKNNIDQKRKKHVSLDAWILIICLTFISLITLYLSIDYAKNKIKYKGFNVDINDNITLFDFDYFINNLNNMSTENKKVKVNEFIELSFSTNEVGEIEELSFGVNIPVGKDFIAFGGKYKEKGKITFSTGLTENNDKRKEKLPKYYEIHNYVESFHKLNLGVFSSILKELDYKERLWIEIGFLYENNLNANNKNILNDNGEIIQADIVNYSGYYTYITVLTVEKYGTSLRGTPYMNFYSLWKNRFFFNIKYNHLQNKTKVICYDK